MSELVQVWFNEIEITEYLVVTSLDRSVGSEATNNLVKIGLNDGKHLKYRTTEEGIIPMGFVLISDVIAKRRELAGILNVSEPGRLVFGDELDKYYMALADGDINMDDKKFYGFGTINWLVPEGVAYSIDEQKVTSTGNTIAVDYKGTAETYPRIEVVNHLDNGFLGFISQEGELVQLGNPDDIDKVPYQQSELVIREQFITKNANWIENEGIVVYPNYLSNSDTPNRQEGSLDWSSSAETVRPVYLNTSEKTWGGPSLNRLVPKTSENINTGNFTQKVRFFFKQKDIKELGRFEVVLQSDQEAFIAVSMRDSYVTKKESIVDFWLHGKHVKAKNINLSEFKTGFYEIEVTRIEAKLTFKLSSINDIQGAVINYISSFNFSYEADTILNKPVTSVTLWAARFSNSQVIDIQFTDYRFWWINVDKLEDIPNLFADEDVVVVDNSSGIVTLNDVANGSFSAIGNDYFSLKPGINNIQLLWSDWAIQPDVTIFYRERWK